MSQPRALRTLSEHDSKALLERYGLVRAAEGLATTPEEAVSVATRLGFPVVVKLGGSGLAHKTERNLVRLGCSDAAAVRAAAADLLAAAQPDDGAVHLLVAEQVRGHRELIAGLVRDPQFGPCVVFGLGGIFTEALGEVVFGHAPLGPGDAEALLDALRARALLGPLRGEAAVDRTALVQLLEGLGRLALERPEVHAVDVNPLIVRPDGLPVAVDALVVLDPQAPRPQAGPRPAPDAATLRARFQPLVRPRGVIVAGASSHPGKFGFAAFHNLLRYGFPGPLFPVNREGGTILGHAVLRDVADVPAGAADLVFVCTPAAANASLLRRCAARGVRAAFVASGGYGETGETGKALETELVRTADELGLLLAGPNGQGLVTPAASLCAQIVAPFPPPGRIGIVSQSGNLVSAFCNYAVLTGIGVSTAISCGNSAQTTIADYLAYFAVDPDTAVVLAYLEGVADGEAFLDAVRRVTAAKPLILVKGGVAAAGQRAAASHTGSLASDDRIFDGLCRQLGVLRAPTVEDAYEWAATFATQPLPRGRRVVVCSTAGGWGVLAADACSAAGLELIPLPETLRERLDRMLPPRWSRNNPIDFAGGETRDTIPEALELVCAHPDVDAVLLLGIGIQSNQAHVFRTGPFFPGHGLDRIVEFHERQDRRYAEAAREASERHQKPVLVATELTYTDRFYGNAGPVAVRDGGRLCYASAHRAVNALRALASYAEYRRRRP